MARINNLTNFLTDVATAIKQKTGDSTPIPASEFDTEILSIETAGTYQQKTLTIIQNGQTTLVPDTGFDAMERVEITVNVPIKRLQTKTVSVTSNGNVSVLPDTGYDGFNEVNLEVNVPSGGEINNQDKTITQNGTYTADSGYTGLGEVTVRVPQEGGSGDVKLFRTVADMQADADPQEGDLAVVYRNELNGITEDSEFSSCTFPRIVVLSEAFTGSVYSRFSAVDQSVRFEGEIDISNGSVTFDSWGSSGSVRVDYQSQDGITYVRTDGGEELQEFGTIIEWDPMMGPWDDVIGNFMKIGSKFFGGFYQYKTDQYVVADSQLDAMSGSVYEKTFYGKNGVETGTLGTPDNSFADTNAAVYSKIKKLYNTMTPRVLTDNDKDIDKNIYIVPSNIDGTPLLDTSGVTNMFRLFLYCKNLIEVSLIDTSNVTNMNGMFYGCSSLTSIPLLNTSNVTNMQQMFGECTSLTTISLLNTSNVTNMYRMFQLCRSLTTIPLLDTSNATNMNGMFDSCSSLTFVPQLDTSSATDIGYMFANCTSLTSIPLLDTSNVTSMYGLFRYCTSLTTIPQLNTSEVKSMGEMFLSCTSLTSVPLLNTSNATNMNSMFSGCSSLTTIPQLNTSNVTDITRMFRECTSLITIPQLDTGKVTSMYNTFSGCTSLSNESLNNILYMCAHSAVTTASSKTLKTIGLTSAQANTCKTLSNYSAFTSAGWTTGY